MTTINALDRALPASTSIDRWQYVGMASLLTLVAVGGFGPNSVAIVAGDLPNPPIIIHVHAALMAMWLGLLLLQPALVATGHLQWHRTLGVVSFAVGPCLVAAMIFAAIWRFDQRAQLGQTGVGANILLGQIRAIVYFSIFFLWAMLARRRDTETHKRMLILATLVLVPAGITRMTWLPTTMPASYFAVHAYMLLLLVPALVFDIVRRGRIHKAYWKGLALLAPWMVATQMLWGSPWWRETAKRLMGVT